MLAAHGVLLLNCLTAAQKNGEISEDKDCEVLANYLFCFVRGLMNVGRNETDKRALRDIADIALTAVTN